MFNKIANFFGFSATAKANRAVNNAIKAVKNAEKLIEKMEAAEVKSAKKAAKKATSAILLADGIKAAEEIAKKAEISNEVDEVKSVEIKKFRTTLREKMNVVIANNKAKAAEKAAKKAATEIKEISTNKQPKTIAQRKTTAVCKFVAQTVASFIGVCFIYFAASYIA